MKLYKKCFLLIRPYWSSKDSLPSLFILLIILGFIFVLVKIQVLLNDWNSDFFNALSNMDKDKFGELILWFVFIVIMLLLVGVNTTWLTKLLLIRWREWLTKYYLDKWLTNKNYYQYYLIHTNDNIDNPDQRISEDIKFFVNDLIDLSLGFIRSLGMLVTFTIVLWQTSGVLSFMVFGHQWHVSGYLFYFALVFISLNTFVAHLIGNKIRKLNIEREQNEANFRVSLIHQHENAEAIALSDGEPIQIKKLFLNFKSIKDNWCNLNNLEKRLDYWQTFHQYVSAVVPLFLLLPQFFAGSINLGGLMKARQAFMLVSNNLSWFIYKYNKLMGLAATIDRLYQFDQFVDNQNELVVNKGNFVEVTDGQIAISKSKFILSNINFEVNSGEWLLLKGRSGLGKTTLLKSIMGIWPYKRGIFVKPNDCMMLIQQSYMFNGSLSEVLSYPSSELFSYQQLENALMRVELTQLIPFLSSTEQWQKKLSSGEKQRICLARVFLFKPSWLFLDEATSHLDEELSVSLLSYLKHYFPQMGVILVSHQKKIWSLADKIYLLDNRAHI